jgi:molybdenum cofactor biosynthesis protein B
VDGRDPGALRCLVATIALGRTSIRDDVTKLVVDELQAVGFQVVRSVTVNREREFIAQLLENVSADNDADVIILLGGSGIGPRDYVCEVVDGLASRRLEGFGEEYRRLLRADGQPAARAVLTRATAGEFNGCVVLALPRQSLPVVRRAMRDLVLPILPEAVRIVAGRGHSPASL